MSEKNGKEINISENDKKENNLEDIDIKEFFRILTNDNYFNGDKTIFFKNYEFLIKVINSLKGEEFVLFINYMNHINVSILKVLINGYFFYDLGNLSINVLEIISKIIRNFFNKDIFYFIYGKLSQLFRNHEFKDENSLIKFKKIFDILKLLYNIEKSPKVYKYDSNNIYFYNIDNKNNNIIIDFNIDKELIDSFEHINAPKETKSVSKKEKHSKDEELIISIEIKFPLILKFNKYIKEFCFLKIYNNTENIVEFKYNDVFKEDDNNDNINTIEFHLSRYQNSTIFINHKEQRKKFHNFDFMKIEKLEILNNFIGIISSITIEKYFYAHKKNVSIKKTYFNFTIKRINNSIPINNNNLIIKGEIFSDNYIDIKKENSFKKSELDLNDIRNFGGLEALIPIFKIIKYIINNLENIHFNSEVNNNIYYLNQFLIFIKDIIKIIIKISLLSEINNQNFYKIIVPLIGALSEILYALNSSNLINQNEIKSFFNDEIFFILYMFILNSNLPNNVKKTFKSVFGINFKDLYFTADSIIFDLNKNYIKNLDWYFSLLFNFVEFTLFYFDSNKIPKKLIEQLNNIYLLKIKEKEKEKGKENGKDDVVQAMEPFLEFIKIFCCKEEPKELINNIFIKSQHLLIKNNFYFMFILNMIKTYLNRKEIIETDNEIDAGNIKELNKINSNNSNENNENLLDNIERIILTSVFGNIEELQKEIFNNFDKYQIILDNFKYYIDHIDFIKKFFPFFPPDSFILKCELLINDLIDYHGEYHHLMKELFIFNRLWSDQKSFFCLNDPKRAKLKYKIINYYTRNFQRPIIYPFLDYKYRYPKFSGFEINKDLFINTENKDDYNFDLECRELDNFIGDYYEKILNQIKKNEKTNVKVYENTCLIKQKYHVKGDLFIINNNTIYFFSYSFSKQNSITCNKKNKENKSCLCYGALFNCLKKEEYIKIKINIYDIRLMMKRIYYYRESAFEIFTETKSYYFNFQNESNLAKFFSLFIVPFKNLYFPINKNNDIKGFKKINDKINKELDYEKVIDKSNFFLEYILGHCSKKESCEMCVFDIIILINLISNRSYIDLTQYPVFPLLFFFDNDDNMIKERDFNEHIGFQRITKEAEFRAALFESVYKEKSNEIERISTLETPFYFSTHYSNNVYTSNYLIRLFPYCFYAIELQGDGFDNPNRLFSSIENTFNNMLKQKSDLRELIPEFYYLPEMFMNINGFNFQANSDNLQVNNVLISKELIDNFLRPNNQKEKEKKLNYSNKEIIYFYFISIMKNQLESLRDKLINWIRIIFGAQQRYNKKGEQYFRTESYIDIDKETKNNYLNDEIIMDSLEFGLIPLQTIYDSKILNNIKKDNYEKFDVKKNFQGRKGSDPSKNIQKRKGSDPSKNIEKKNNKKSDIKKNIDIDYKYDNFMNNNKILDYWEESLSYKFTTDYNKLIIERKEIKRDNEEIIEVIDHNAQIIDNHFNPRLNMYATTSIDGYICIYIVPNKLVSMIKHPNTYYEQILLSANPFPTIIAFDKKEKKLISYSISGIKIKSIIITAEGPKIGTNFKIKPLFNEYGGNSQDRIILYSNSGFNTVVNVPFFNEEFELNI